MDVVFFRFLDFTFLGGLYFSFSMQIFRLTSTSLLVSALHVYVILFEITKYLTSFRHHFLGSDSRRHHFFHPFQEGGGFALLHPLVECRAERFGFHAP